MNLISKGVRSKEKGVPAIVRVGRDPQSGVKIFEVLENRPFTLRERKKSVTGGGIEPDARRELQGGRKEKRQPFTGYVGGTVSRVVEGTIVRNLKNELDPEKDVEDGKIALDTPAAIEKKKMQTLLDHREKKKGWRERKGKPWVKVGRREPRKISSHGKKGMPKGRFVEERSQEVEVLLQ